MPQPDVQTVRLLAYLRKEPASLARFLATFCLFALFSGFIIAGLQPAASMELPFALAVVQWVLHIVFGMLIVTSIASAAVLTGLRLTWSVGLAIVFLPIVLTPLSLATEASIAYLAGTQDQDPDSFFEELQQIALPAVGLASLVALFALKAAAYVANQRTRILAGFAAEPDLRSVFPDLPHRVGNELLSVSANDHYVTIRTANGSAMLSRKFSDCLEKLKPFAGLQVHRSHWVRRKHVDQVRANGSSYLCTLSDGTAIPVSRRRYAELKHTLSGPK